MKNPFFIKTVLLVILLVSFRFSFAQVGIGELNPDSKLDIVNTQATGNSVEVSHDNVTNVSSALLIKNNSNVASAINAQNLSVTNTNPVIEIHQNSFGVAIYSILNTLGGFGEYVDLDSEDGTGIHINAVDNPASPTTGGDVFGFNADIYTQTPIVGGLISGAVLTGNQYGVGHGILLNHSGVQGINSEFNSTNAANTNPTIQAINLGRGSAIVGQNQSNIIPGTIAVADFSYTGAAVTDHMGVSGYSRPIAGWGVGVLGEGGWFGVYSLGNSGSSGVKTFAIDHPKDPENKILRHFSIESNEVLNIYRGTTIFNNNGSAVVTLPDYYHSINRDASYQLTPIGAPMPNIYIEKEIKNGQFVISGGVANKKVSWIVTAERNDPYLQQQPDNRDVIIEKIGSRKGKYLTPDLYNQPKEKGIFYNENNQNLKPSKTNKQNIKLKK